MFYVPHGLYQIYANRYVFLSYINLRAHVQINDVGLLGFLKLLRWWLSFRLGLIDTFCLLIVELKVPTVRCSLCFSSSAHQQQKSSSSLGGVDCMQIQPIAMGTAFGEFYRIFKCYRQISLFCEELKQRVKFNMVRLIFVASQTPYDGIQVSNFSIKHRIDSNLLQ